MTLLDAFGIFCMGFVIGAGVMFKRWKKTMDELDRRLDDAIWANQEMPEKEK